MQPPDPIEKWTYEPFSGKIANGRIYGRGASDNKGNLISRLKAVQTLLEVTDDVPVNLKFFVDGEEEIGSPHLEPVIKKYKDYFLRTLPSGSSEAQIGAVGQTCTWA